MNQHQCASFFPCGSGRAWRACATVCSDALGVTARKHWASVHWRVLARACACALCVRCVREWGRCMLAWVNGCKGARVHVRARACSPPGRAGVAVCVGGAIRIPAVARVAIAFAVARRVALARAPATVTAPAVAIARLCTTEDERRCVCVSGGGAGTERENVAVDISASCELSNVLVRGCRPPRPPREACWHSLPAPAGPTPCACVGRNRAKSHKRGPGGAVPDSVPYVGIA